MTQSIGNLSLSKLKIRYRDILKIPPMTEEDIARFGHEDDKFYFSPDGKSVLIFYERYENRMDFYIGFLGFIRQKNDEYSLGTLGSSWQPIQNDMWLGSRIFYVRGPVGEYNPQTDRVVIRLFDLESLNTATLDFRGNLYRVSLQNVDEESFIVLCDDHTMKTWGNLHEHDKKVIHLKDLEWHPINGELWNQKTLG